MTTDEWRCFSDPGAERTGAFAPDLASQFSFTVNLGHSTNGESTPARTRLLGSLELADDSDCMTSHEIVSRYIAEKTATLSPSTISQYKRCAIVLWKSIDPTRPIGEITAADVDRVLTDNARTPTLANRTVQLIGAAWRYAYERGHTDIRCIAGRARLFREKPRSRYLPKPQLRLVLAAAREAIVAGRRVNTCCGVILLALSGARIGELLSAKWSGVDWKAGTMAVNGKTGPRDVALTDAAIELMQWMRRRNPDQLGIHGTDTDWDGPVVRASHGGIAKALAWLCEKAGVPYVSPHDLRRSFAVLAREAGVPIAHIAAALGHQDVRVTMRAYSIATGSGAQKAASAVAGVLEGD